MNSSQSDTHTIAVSGVAGSGKTTLVRNLARVLPSASPLFSDTYRSVALWAKRYQQDGLNAAESIEQWFRDGFPADDYWSVPQLVDDIRALQQGQSIHTPEPMWEGGEHHIEPARFILLEDCWAHRSEMRPLVSAFVHIHCPLDIALARRIQRDLRQGENLHALMEQYLDIGHTYSNFVNQSKAHHALILDGTLHMDKITQDALRWIQQTFPS